MWPAGEPMDRIVAAVNALPGEAANAAQCRAQAGNLKLKRPAVSSAPPPREGRERTGDPPSVKDGAAPTERDELECKVELRKGRSVRDLVEEFGFPFRVIQAWQDDLRAEKGMAA
jgi:hypothetical protein